MNRLFLAVLAAILVSSCDTVNPNPQGPVNQAYAYTEWVVQDKTTGLATKGLPASPMSQRVQIVPPGHDYAVWFYAKSSAGIKSITFNLQSIAVTCSDGSSHPVNLPNPRTPTPLLSQTINPTDPQTHQLFLVAPYTFLFSWSYTNAIEQLKPLVKQFPSWVPPTTPNAQPLCGQFLPLHGTTVYTASADTPNAAYPTGVGEASELDVIACSPATDCSQYPPSQPIDQPSVVPP